MNELESSGSKILKLIAGACRGILFRGFGQYLSHLLLLVGKKKYLYIWGISTKRKQQPVKTRVLNLSFGGFCIAFKKTISYSHTYHSSAQYYCLFLKLQSVGFKPCSEQRFVTRWNWFLSPM